MRTYRFAWTDGFGVMPVPAEMRSALEGLARSLEQAGCSVERRAPDLELEEVWSAWGRLLGAEVGSEMPVVARLMMALRFQSMRGNCALKGGECRTWWARAMQGPVTFVSASATDSSASSRQRRPHHLDAEGQRLLQRARQRHHRGPRQVEEARKAARAFRQPWLSRTEGRRAGEHTIAWVLGNDSFKSLVSQLAPTQ